MKRRIRGGRSYLIIDNRASGGTRQEYATLTCGHCHTVVVLHPERKRERGWCRRCNSYTCDGVCSKPDSPCVPIEKAVELALRYPGLPTLSSGYHGELLFDPKYLEEGKPHMLGAITTQEGGTA